MKRADLVRRNVPQTAYVAIWSICRAKIPRPLRKGMTCYWRFHARADAAQGLYVVVSTTGAPAGRASGTFSCSMTPDRVRVARWRPKVHSRVIPAESLETGHHRKLAV